MNPEVVGLVCSRSGLALKDVVVMNSPGIIDADYRWEVQVMLHNFSDEPRTLVAGTRVAQLVFVNWLDSGEVVEVQREGGFGSTGE
jgi:dUTP pyrophosphatase